MNEHELSVRRWAAIGTASVVAVVALVATAPSAAGLHQYCGADKVGVRLGGYAGATSDNGHPEGPDADGGSWVGRAAVKEARIAAFTFAQAEGLVDATVNVLNGYADEPVQAAVRLDKALIAWILRIGRITAEAVVLHREHANAEVNACNSVMMGDMVDTLFVAMLEEELAYQDVRNTGSEPGSRLSPSALFLLPDDGLPDTQQDATQRYQDGNTYPSHSGLGITYQHGFADAKYIGVATVVRNTIAYMKLYGMPTGDAEFRWAMAMDYLRQGDLRNANLWFADAYQTAVTAN